LPPTLLQRSFRCFIHLLNKFPKLGKGLVLILFADDQLVFGRCQFVIGKKDSRPILVNVSEVIITRAIITEYDLPRETIQPHDVVVDADGIAWYSSFGEQNLGKLDPRSGKVTEFPIALNKPGFPSVPVGQPC